MISAIESKPNHTCHEFTKNHHSMNCHESHYSHILCYITCHILIEFSQSPQIKVYLLKLGHFEICYHAL